MFGKSFKSFLLLSLLSQAGHIGFGPRYRLMSPDDDGGGGDDGKDKDKDKDKDDEFKAKLLKEKNNWRTRAQELEEELKALREGKGGDDKDKDKDKGGDDKYKELLRAKDEENKKTADKLAKLEKEREDGMKLGSLREEFEKNGGDPKKFPLIQRLAETSKIIIDDDSGVVYGAEGEVKRIKELAPELFGKAKKGVDDGDTGNKDRHDTGTEGDEAFKKTLEGSRLKKTKDGKNPFEALYAAKGMTISAKKI